MDLFFVIIIIIIIIIVILGAVCNFIYFLVLYARTNQK